MRYFDQLSDEQVQTLLKSLDSVYKFSKEFNSEVNLRFKLWKSGYMQELDHLPGLLAHEEESLKVYLSILFKQFHLKQSNVNKPLFALCSKVLKDYNLKHSELISINASK
jgi:brefeldin A-inhibited guanine nucleotide-exchange protein